MDNRRDQLIEFVEREFIGPDPVDMPGMVQENGEEILTIDPPRTRYIAGILFPKETSDASVDIREGESEPLESSEDVDQGAEKSRKTYGDFLDSVENAEELINRSNAYRQSAISLTVAAPLSSNISVEVSAGVYTTISYTDPVTEKKGTKYARSPLSWNNSGEVLSLPTETDRFKVFPLGETGLRFDVTYRYRIESSVVYTFTLENSKSSNGTSVKDDDCFFQTKFILSSDKGFSALSDSQRITKDEDYRSNQLLYRNVKNYAIGHGCAADWEEADSVHWISTAIFPKYDIKPIVPSAIVGVSLEMLKMSPFGNFKDTIDELKLMCQRYREWIDSLKTLKNTLSTEFLDTADRHISNCEICLNRMENGIELLQQNKDVRILLLC